MSSRSSCRAVRAVSVLAALYMAAPAGAQGVVLRIMPSVGDTLHTRFEQEMEITGRTRVGASDTTLTMRHSMVLLSRVIVQASESPGVEVLAITDSLALLSSGRTSLIPESQRRALQGGRVRMLITPEGTATVLDAPATLASDLQSVVSQMPATLPARAVRVGSTWSQEMSIPIAGQADGGAATLQATFRLDSLTRGGNLAHISMRGTIDRDSTAGDLPSGAKLVSTGSVTGTIQIDRRRGWWTDSRAVIHLRSVMIPPPGSGAEPMHFQTRITHHMWTESKR